jgi:hypothetical protein
MMAGLVVVFVVVGCGVWCAGALAAGGYEFRGEFAGEGGPLAVSEASNDVYVGDGGKVEVFEASGLSGSLVSEFTGEKAPGGSFSASSLAVDNSKEPLDPSAGDVYVLDRRAGLVDKFTAKGEYAGEQLTGTCEKPEEPPPCGGSKLIPFEECGAIAVDADGDVWIYAERKGEGGHVAWLDEFSDTGVFLKSLKVGSFMEITSGLAVDSNGDLYVLAFSEPGRPPNERIRAVEKFSPAGAKLSVIGEGDLFDIVSSVAVEAVSGVVFVDAFVPGTDFDREAVDEFGPFGEPPQPPVKVFPAGGFGSLGGLAVDAGDGSSPSSGLVYASEPGRGVVHVGEFVELPGVVTGGASGQTAASVVLGGSVDPEGIQVSSCSFEYGTSEALGQSVACAQSPASIGAGTSPVAVSAGVSGLEAGRLYYYRLRAGNARFGSEVGAVRTVGPPQISGEVVSGVTASGATVSARIDPEQSVSEYDVEYGPSTAYGHETALVSVGTGSSSVNVAEALSGLAAQGTYHARLVARNASGVSYGADMEFTTLAVSAPESSSLPDGRVYEAVSTPGELDAEVYVPRIELSEGFTHAVTTETPFQVSGDGAAVAFPGAPAGSNVSGSSGRQFGNEFLARRGSGGWDAQDLQPTGVASAFYQAFTGDLGSAFVNANVASPLSALAPGEGYDVLYSSIPGSGVFSPLFTVKPADRTAEEFGSPGVEVPDPYAPLTANNKPEPVAFAGEGGGRVFFEADDALLAGSGTLEKELAATAKREAEDGEEGNFLYESFEGRLGVVDLLPTTGKVVGQAQFGSGDDFSGAVSADGSRVYWSAEGQVFVREDGAKTARVSEGTAQFWAASKDGRYAFYTEGERLLRFDVEGETPGEEREELAGAGAGVQGVLGVSEDGEYVYFVAEGVLASGASAGQPNLYLYHAGATTLVATLSPQDNGNAWFQSSGSSPIRSGDWMADVGDRTAEVAPDGQSVVFMSQARIKTVNFPEGYDNQVTEQLDNVGKIEVSVHDLAEVYVYEAEGGGVYCVSCTPGGAPPSVYDPRSANAIGEVAAVLPISWSNTYQMRWLSDSGGRVFFDSFEPLVGRDSNGTFDVYEWERDGEGSCGESDGCIYLLSGGGGSQQNASYLAGASESGDDVFILSRSQLAPGVQGDSMSLYDARVGGSQPPSQSGCPATGCASVPPVAAGFEAPASETFSGPGNPPQPPAENKKPTVKPPTRAQKLAAALKACKKDKSRSKRVACEARAHKAYGTTAKKTARKAARKAARRGRGS